MASYLHDSNYFLRTAFRLLVNTHGNEFFVKKTLHQYLWDNRDPVLVTSKNIVPGIVPVDNMGFLLRVSIQLDPKNTFAESASGATELPVILPPCD